MDRPLELAPLSCAIASLERAIEEPKSEFVRDSVIQRFEYTYELAWKLLKRHMEWDEGVENVDHLTRRDLFRLAAEKGLIEEVREWFAFHRARNETSHAYNENKAEEVYAVAVRFAVAARALLNALEKRENA